MADLNDFLSIISEGKQDYKTNDPMGKRLEEVKSHLKFDLNGLFEQIESLTEKGLQPADNPPPMPHVEIPLPELKPASQQYTPAEIQKINHGASFQQPNPELVSKNIDEIRSKLRFMEQAISKIAATGPGSGEVNLRYLDDVDRSTISDGKWLKYSAATKKFIFDDINPYEVVHNTTLVETDTYTIMDNDYYVGINYNGSTNIILPGDPSSGRMLIIKDESGNASIHPITVSGTVDNDTGGFIIQLDNGAIQLIYRNGWRIV